MAALLVFRPRHPLTAEEHTRVHEMLIARLPASDFHVLLLPHHIDVAWLAEGQSTGDEGMVLSTDQRPDISDRVAKLERNLQGTVCALDRVLRLFERRRPPPVAEEQKTGAG